jgi:hypothetical protein
MIKNFLQKLIRNLAPDVFKPDPYTPGLLYLTLDAIQREISGICPWDTGEECLKGYDSFWSSPCRNFNCPGYLHPHGLIAYTSRSSSETSVDNRFDYSSFRYLAGDGDDWIPAGTLGTMVLFNFGFAGDPGGYGAYYYGALYYGDNSRLGSGVGVAAIGDKWYITCHTASIVIGTDGLNYRCKRQHLSASNNKPITGDPLVWPLYWEQGGLAGDTWIADAVYDIVSIVGPPIADPGNRGGWCAVATKGPYSGDHDTIYTVEIIDFRGYIQDFQNALLQISLASCTESWLDYWGAYFGIPRLLTVSGYEEDEIYRARIMKEITRAKGTRSVLLEEAQAYFKSDLVSIEEYHQKGAASVVLGTDDKYYICILNHTSEPSNRPITGDNWALYWKQGGLAGDTWKPGLPYVIETSPRWDGPVAPTIDCPSYGVGDPAQGLWPWEFYINIPAQRSLSGKFIKSAEGDTIGPCSCDQACYGQSSCSCDMTTYGAVICSCDTTCYGHQACQASCDLQRYGVTDVQGGCVCNVSCYGYHACDCDGVCYGYACSCDQTCYQETPTSSIASPQSSQPTADELARLNHIHAFLIVYDANWDNDKVVAFENWLIANGLYFYGVGGGTWNINLQGQGEGGLYEFLDIPASRALAAMITDPLAHIYYASTAPDFTMPFGSSDYANISMPQNKVGESFSYDLVVTGTDHYALNVWVAHSPTSGEPAAFALVLTFPDARTLTFGYSPGGSIDYGYFNVIAQNAPIGGGTPNIADAHIPEGTWKLTIIMGSGIYGGTGGQINISTELT